MIMSYLTHLEVSYLKTAIILSIEGGCYGRKGHYHNDTGRIKTTAYN